MIELERPTDSSPVTQTNVDFDDVFLKAVYRIAWKAMGDRRTIADMEADDLVQAVLLIILAKREFGPEKLGHFGLIKTIAVNFVRRAEQRASGRPKHEMLSDALRARRQPDPLLVREFLEQAELFLNDSHLELLTLCLKNGYRLDVKADRKAAAAGMGISLDHLRHMLDKLRTRHREIWRQYLSLF